MGHFLIILQVSGLTWETFCTQVLRRSKRSPRTFLISRFNVWGYRVRFVEDWVSFQSKGNSCHDEEINKVCQSTFSSTCGSEVQSFCHCHYKISQWTLRRVHSRNSSNFWKLMQSHFFHWGPTGSKTWNGSHVGFLWHTGYHGTSLWLTTYCNKV